jgi:hypothetical protein
MKITNYAQRIHHVQLANGYWNPPNFYISQGLLLYELSSLLRADRLGRVMTPDNYNIFDRRIESPNSNFVDAYKEAIRYSVEDHIAGAMFYTIDYLWMEYSLSSIEEHILDANITDKSEQTKMHVNNFPAYVMDMCKSCMSAVYLENVGCDLIWLANSRNINLEQHLQYRILFEESNPIKYKY